MDRSYYRITVFYFFLIPYWILNIITNDFINLNYIDKLCHYINIGDLIAVLGSIDSVSGSVDSVPIAVIEVFINEVYCFGHHYDAYFLFLYTSIYLF